MTDELPAGRELDAKVAEAMGLKLDYEFAEMYGEPRAPALRDQYDEWGILPFYSTDIAAAWAVVEYATDHSRLDWCTFRMNRATWWTDPTWGYDVFFGRQYDPTHQRERLAWAPTAALAICRAFLLVA